MAGDASKFHDSRGQPGSRQKLNGSPARVRIPSDGTSILGVNWSMWTPPEGHVPMGIA